MSVISPGGARYPRRAAAAKALRYAALLPTLVALGASVVAAEPRAKPIAEASADVATTPSASGNTCVSCHRSRKTIQTFQPWEREHFILWSLGEHGRRDVTCEKCHGGDPSAAEASAAHAGMRPSNDPLSPVYFQNLPKTCGTCHADVYNAFVLSSHYRELVHDRLAPSCNTCHGFQMDIAVPSESLVDSCQLCHNREPNGVKPGVVGAARSALDHISRARKAIGRARFAIELAGESAFATPQADERLREAESRLAATGIRWHRFHLDAFERELKKIEDLAESSENSAMEAILKR